MPKIFKRGELKQALLAVVGSLEEAHGYAIMQELQHRVGRGWKPSPGAIYPALVALEDERLLHGEERGGLRLYRLTAAGQQVLEAQASSTVWQAAGRRFEAAKPVVTTGKMLDHFAREAPNRKRELSDAEAAAVAAALAEAGQKITDVLTRGEDDG
jgi:DNA-binding PadR family transcriptional regulator